MNGNWLDTLVEYFAPHAGIRRRAARGVLAAYEAATPSRQRKFRRDSGGPDQQVQKGAVAIRTQARHFDQNHDIARGILRTLVNNTVGPNGIGIEPQPRRVDGTIHEEYAKLLREGWRDWTRAPEVTGRLHWARSCRLMGRTWIRDGEAFAQELIGGVPFLDHGTRVPYSLELFEPDMVPMDYSDGDRIRQGIECNAWGKPVGYWVYKKHPGENTIGRSSSDMKRIGADRMLHLAFLDRLGQRRGVSEFASVITRLEDIKDYEESERIAAKIAAMFTAYIRKGTPELYNPESTDKYADGTPKARDMRLAPGMIIDNLIPGEEVGMIDSNRPNPNLITFRQGQLRAVAAGTNASYSSISRDYGGTFSSQRQELVEQWINYSVMTDDFTGQFVQPVWERFVQVAHLSGVIPRPADVPEALADDASYIAQAMPWIDPYKEAMAWELLAKNGFASEIEVMRRRGVNPRDVLEQIDTWRAAAKEKGLVFSSDAANDTGAAAAAPKDTTPPTDGAADSPTDKQDGMATAMGSLAAGVASMAVATAAVAARDPSVVIHQGDTNITTPPVAVQVDGAIVTVTQPEIHNHLPETVVNMEANIETPPAQVVVAHPDRAIQTMERDPETLEVVRTIIDYERDDVPRN